MARDLTGRSCTGDPDDAPPVGAMGQSRRIPACLHCGAIVPGAHVLYTLCPRCIAGGPEPPLTLSHPSDREAHRRLISDTAGRMALRRRARGSREEPLAGPVVAHRDRLKARGLPEASALRLAEGMVSDPAHRMTCAICGGSGGGDARQKRAE